MYGIEILVVSVLVASTHGTNSSLFSNWKSSWIIGGIDAAPGEFPYMASIRRVIGNPHQCGGSIISNFYILTAAHCVSGKLASSLIVVVGTNTLDSAGQRHTISRIIIHDGYLSDGQSDNIALLKLTEPIVYSSTVKPVTLPKQNERIPPKSKCTLSGWGSTEACEEMTSNHLQKLRFKIVRYSVCQEHYHENSFLTKLCAMPYPGRAATAADSGGPLVCKGKQLGIYAGVRTDRSSCPIGVPTAQIRVSTYIVWIKQKAV